MPTPPTTISITVATLLHTMERKKLSINALAQIQMIYWINHTDINEHKIGDNAIIYAKYIFSIINRSIIYIFRWKSIWRKHENEITWFRLGVSAILPMISLHWFLAHQIHEFSLSDFMITHKKTPSLWSFRFDLCTDGIHIVPKKNTDHGIGEVNASFSFFCYLVHVYVKLRIFRSLYDVCTMYIHNTYIF